MRYPFFIIAILYFFFFPNIAFGDEDAMSHALEYIKSKQDESGKITTGFSAPSQWSTLAFTTHGIDVATVKKSTYSLYDFLLIDIPINNAATDYETRILAIVAANGNPTNFNGFNYLEHLEGFYNNGQIGDICSLNDDIFGLLALLASGDTADIKIKEAVLHYLIVKQDTDGGFSFSSPGCDWYSTSADMTAAGLQALVKAKENNIAGIGLDAAIVNAKNYLLTNQHVDGGFGYFGSSDADSTGWVIIGFNALGMKDSEEVTKAKAYLLLQQSHTDGGFMTFDWTTNTLVSNATTTAQALIALSGKTWVEKIYDVSITAPLITPAPKVAPSSTGSSTPIPNSELLSIDQSTVMYQTITVTTTPYPKKNNTPEKTYDENIDIQTAILGVKSINDENPKQKTMTIIASAAKNPEFLFISFGALCISIAFLWHRFYK